MYSYLQVCHIIIMNDEVMIIDFILDVAAKTGIILDPVYTGKTALGLVRELNHNRDRFKGDRILFIHTGKAANQCTCTIIICQKGAGRV